MGTIFVPSDLTKETQNAVSVLESAFPYRDAMYLDTVPQDGLLRTGFMMFTRNPISTAAMPSEDHWSWNQCNKKKMVVLESMAITATITKFNARRTPRSEGVLPRNKAWIFGIRADRGDRQLLYFLWVERGSGDCMCD
mmetsp:Transcript_12176/g.48947  ORF Transcript_12176/g.48947 Transcript_12176/m.48947 type:complete len:138 (+) Transcript_12176:90-503(+)